MGEAIFVSTIHRAKGREFDNVFLLLEGFSPKEEEQKRQLYVAMTRAKGYLSVHLNGNYLSNIKVEDMTCLADQEQYAKPNELALQLAHKDVWLNYFIERQDTIHRLQSGDSLVYRDGHWLTEQGLSVFRVSKAFAERLEELRQEGYVPTSAKVNFVVWWKGEDHQEEVMIVLPEVHLQRQG